MELSEFKIESYFDQYESSTPYPLSLSDCETMSIRELLALEPGAEEAFLAQGLGYTAACGDPELRGLIAGLYEGVGADCVLTFTGAEEGIFAAMNVLLADGGHVVCMWPAYQSLFELAGSLPGCSYSKWEIHDTGEGWALDIDELEALIRPDTRAVVLATPNNPTGLMLSDDELSQICDICDRRGIRLFSDEVYRGLELDGLHRSSAVELSQSALALGAISKSYGLAGLRVGWIVCHDHALLQRIKNFKRFLNICGAGPSEFLAKIALAHSDELIARSIKTIRRNKEIADMFFLEHGALFTKRDMEGGPIAFHKLLIDMPIATFCERVRTDSGVLLLPGSVYGVEEPYFRMGYGRKSFPEALMRLDSFLQASRLAVKDEAAIAMLPFILNGLTGL